MRNNTDITIGKKTFSVLTILLILNIIAPIFILTFVPSDYIFISLFIDCISIILDSFGLASISELNRIEEAQPQSNNITSTDYNNNDNLVLQLEKRFARGRSACINELKISQLNEYKNELEKYKEIEKQLKYPGDNKLHKRFQKVKKIEKH